MNNIILLIFLPLVFSKSLENHFRGYTPDVLSDISLVTFDGQPSSTFEFRQMNDPVMGGISSGTWSLNEVEEFGIMEGSVRDVPSLHAPGFIKAYADGAFNDASEAFGGDLVLNIRSTTSEYTGFRVSFAAGTLTPDNACAGGGVVPFSKGCFKTKFIVEADDEFSEIRIPFNTFSDHWSPATGDQLTTCSEDPSACPTAKDLAGIKRIEVWAEGVAGDVNLEVKSIYASPDRCSKIFETYPEADCILYDDEKCDGAEGIKVMKDGDKATNFEETYGFDVESISIKKGHKLTIYQGNSLNGKSKKFVADASDVHVSDEELKSFDDNVNSAKCVGINTIPDDSVSINEVNFDCDDLITDDCPENILHKILTIRNVQNLTKCMDYCDHTISYPTCRSFYYDSLNGDCILYDNRLSQYIDLCNILGSGTDTVEQCLSDDESYPDTCKNLLEANCYLKGNIINTYANTTTENECYSKKLDTEEAKFFIFNENDQQCTIYDSNERVCEAYHGAKGVTDCQVG